VTGRVLVLLAGLVVGFLLVGQLRTSSRFSQQLSAESEGDLARILAGLTSDADNLRDQVDTLKLQLLDLQNSSQRNDAAGRTAEEQLRALEVLAGTVPVNGPGVVVNIDDPQSSLHYDLMIDVIQELRDAGAEALAVNGHRIGAASAFADSGSSIAIDGTALTAPYHVSAIGQPPTLEGGMDIPGGALDTLQAQRGVKVEVQRSASLQLPALTVPPTFRVARPVGSQP
jgi:uncharacterized protein YlxW (UPF0749 family)